MEDLGPTEYPFLAIKWPLSSDEVTSEWSYTSKPHVYLQGVNRDNSPFLHLPDIKSVAKTHNTY
jgi:hypothetical protein